IGAPSARGGQAPESGPPEGATEDGHTRRTSLCWPDRRARGAPVGEASESRSERDDTSALQTRTEDEAEAIAHELEGEGQDRLVGIMYSEKQWVVPESYKVVFLLCAFALLAALAWYTVDKRLDLRRLMMDSVVEPTPVRDVPAPDFVLPE